MDNTKRAQMGRLKWHSRRALLELDILLERFWAQRGDDLDDRNAVALTRLLALEDHDLWDLVSGRVDTDDPELGSFIGVLRGTDAGMLNNLKLTN
jgi:antitoxin CptB